MPAYELTETVSKDPQTVWDYFVDPANTPEWNSSTSEASLDGEPRVGGVIATKASFMGVRIDSTAEITECEEPTRYRFVAEKPMHLDIAVDFVADGGGTRIVMTADIEPGKLFPVGGRLIGRQIEKTLKKDLKTLAAKVDAL